MNKTVLVAIIAALVTYLYFQQAKPTEHIQASNNIIINIGDKLNEQR